jgi:DNA polymerase-3 subunit alpha
MKANFPVEYMSAVLTADSGDTDKISEIIRECERMNIEVLPPDINESFADFSVVPGKPTIRFGLTTIKNFGEGISEAIIEERKAHGLFTSMQDFLSRIKNRNLNKKSLEALIMVGAFDRFGERGHFMANVDLMLGFNREQLTAAESAQDSLFGGLASVSTLNLLPGGPALASQMLIWEKDLLGVYVSGHPLDKYQDELAKRPSISSIKQAIAEQNEMAIVQMKGSLVTAGMITSVRELLTKKGDKMAFVVLGDQKDQIEMVAFPSTYMEQKDLFVPGTCIAVKGKLTIRNDEPSIALDRIKNLAPIVET